jgi:orotate phosphoribosyltransferase
MWDFVRKNRKNVHRIPGWSHHEDLKMSEKTPRDKLLSLIRERSYRSGEFKLASGKTSNFYFDGKMVELMPEGAHLIGEVVYDELKDLEFEAISGLAVGAVPMVTSAAISFYHHGKSIEGTFVRSEVKSHGTRKIVEGKLAPGDRVVVVDDVATSGKSLMQAINAVQEAGATVELVLVIVDRQEGAADFFREQGYPFRGIFTKDQVMEADHVAVR